MASIKFSEIKKYNEAAGNDFQFDVSGYVMHNEKTLNLDIEQENGNILEFTICYMSETEGEGWSAKRTGRQIPTLRAYNLVKGFTESCYHVNFLFDEVIGEAKTKKMFNYLLKLSNSVDMEPYKARALEMINPTETEEAPEPVEVDENSAISKGMKFEDASGDVYTITKLDAMQVEFNSGARSLYDFGTSRTVGAVLHGLGNGAHLISAPQDTQTDTETDEATTAEEEPETTPETATEGAQTAETEISEEEPTEEKETAQTDEEQPTTAPEAENNKPDYSALAAAYFTGKTIKATKKPKKAPQEETTTEPEQAEEEPKKESHPLKTEYGYTGAASDKFTAEEIQTLTDGGQVANKDQYSHNAIFFTTPYSDRTRLVYYVTGATRPTPGNDPKYCGFITDGAYYQHTSAIKDELNADINTAILQTVTSEADAQTKAEEQERGSWGEYNLRTAEELKTREYNDSAQRYFYGNEEPELITNNRYNDQSEAEIIKYIESPAEAVKNQAQTWTDTRAIEIYKAYIIYNRTAPLYYDILNNKDNIEHRIKRMSATVAEEKTLRIELTHGSIIKVDAGAIKYLGNRNGKIYNYDILEDTKQDIQRTDYGHNESITADQIKAIYHGQRTLYRAA